MSYEFDRYETNPIHEIERQERQAALRHTPPGFCPPGHHDMRPDGRGGGVCECGETVDRDEL